MRAINTVGDTTVYAAPAVGYPTQTVVSDPSNIADVLTPAYRQQLQPTWWLLNRVERVHQSFLTWTDNANNETNFTVQRSTNGSSVGLHCPPLFQHRRGSVELLHIVQLPNLVELTFTGYMARNAVGNSAPSNVVMYHDSIGCQCRSLGREKSLPRDGLLQLDWNGLI